MRETRACRSSQVTSAMRTERLKWVDERRKCINRRITGWDQEESDWQ